jgi:hypothetical protein
MAIVTKITFDYDTKLCKFEDLNPAGVLGEMILTIVNQYQVTKYIELGQQITDVYFDLPLDINGDILEGDYEFEYSQLDAQDVPLDTVNLSYTFVNPTWPTVQIALESSVTDLEVTSVDNSIYAIDDYTVTWDRTHTIQVPVTSGISDAVQEDDNTSPVDFVTVEPLAIDGVYIGSVEVAMVATDDVSGLVLTKTLTGSTAIAVASQFYTSTTVDAMNNLNNSYLEALGTNFLLSENLKQKLFRVMTEWMLYENYKQQGDVDNALIHSTLIEELLNE